MSGTIPMLLPKRAQEGILQFYRQCYQLTNQQWNIRPQLESIDRLYMREVDFTAEQVRARIANKYGDSNRFQNITVPIVMPQVEAAVTYQTSVFLTGNPIFGVVADPTYEDEALQLQTVIEENSVRGGWTGELIKFFRDGFKYNLAAMEVTWDNEVTPAFETDLAFSAKEAKPTEVIWSGNCIKKLNLYNTFWDTRVAPVDVYKKGEFAGYTELMSRIALKQFIAELPDKMIANIIPAFESGMGANGIVAASNGVQNYYIPQINPDAILQRNQQASTDWLAWAGMNATNNSIQYKNMYEVTTLYGRILPSDFGLTVPAANTPQVWKFIIVNNQVIIYAERLTNAHGYIPVLFSQPLEDGLEYQTKSLAQNVAPIQSITTALANSIVAARRRAISDRTIYDPSRIDSKHINNDNPSAKIPVKPAAYGKNITESVYAFPFRDDQAGLVSSEIQTFTAMANNISGQNPVRQGQFVKGNKTQHEFADVMSNANGRDQMCSIQLEAQVFTPLKEILKINILQYQGGTSLYSPSTAQQVTVDPIALRKAVLNFKVSDGLTPTDKLINSDVMMVAMQQIGSSPQIASGYNIAPLFSYLMKTQGASITAFEKSQQQIAYEQAMSQWSQTVQMIYKNNPAQDPNKLPAQPVPQNYGYDPNATPGVDSSKSAVQPVNSSSSSSSSQQPASQPNQGVSQ